MNNRRNIYQEPSFGGNNEVSNENDDNIPITPPPANTNRPRRRRRKKSGGWFSKLIILIILAGIGYGGFNYYHYYMRGHVSLDSLNTPSTNNQVSPDDFQEPHDELTATDYNLANVKWCLRQQLRLETLADITDTNTESSKIINAYKHYQDKCDLSQANVELVTEGNIFILENEEAIIAETKEDQLFILSNLSTGSWQGDDLVLEVQNLLDQLGYEVGAPDGKLGRLTRTALIAFQRDQGLAETGQVNVKTLEDLQRAINLNSKNNNLNTIDLTN